MIRRKKLFANTIAAALIGTTALAPAVSAQEYVDAANAGDHCVALSGLLTDRQTDLQPGWTSNAQLVQGQGDIEACRVQYDEAAAALNLPGTTATEEQQIEAAARIIVTQPDPSVTVEQQSPEVAVTQRQPEISINQGQPVIEVREARPTISIEMPRPVITIDQPQPEIIIRMPEPLVALNMPQPEVEVRQREPNVTVEQGQPQIQVNDQLAAAGENEADIDINQQDVQLVQREAAGEPLINVQRDTPQVLFVPAEPNIQFGELQQPEVRFNQSGDPQVRFEDVTSADATTGAGALTTDPAQNQQMANAGQDDDIRALIVTDQPMVAGTAQQPMDVAAIIGMELHNWNGEELGTVQNVATDGAQPFLILSADTPLSSDNTPVLLPVSNIAMVDDELIMRGLTEAQLLDLQAVDATSLEALSRTDMVDLGTN